MRRIGLLALPLGLGFVFLYLPLVLMALVSFSAGRMVTGFDGFSLRWYGALFANGPLAEALLRSLGIAAVAASLATVLGTLGGFALARIGRFRGRAGFAAVLAAPLVMPEVITGLSLLLFFVAMEAALGFPAGRGLGTVAIAHATLGTAYVAVVVQARLAGLGESLEEAAADLGAPPWAVFARVTLPLAAPAVGAGWLLAFTLSLDDLVIASFVSGPGASTLPMVVFSSTRLGVTPELYALATLLVMVAAGGLLLARRLRVSP